MAANNPDVHFFDPFPLFCPGETCTAHIPGTREPAFIDISHLTDAGSLYLWPFLCDFFRTLGVL